MSATATPTPTRAGSRAWAPPSHREVMNALTAACEAVGLVPPGDPAWEALVPLLHELADAISDGPSTPGWPSAPVVACRRLAVATRRYDRSPAAGTDTELVLAAADLVVVRATRPA